MKRLLLFFIFCISTMVGPAQNVYFGYPASDVQLKSGDLIILNIPTHQDWMFIPDGPVSELVNFLNRNTNDFFTMKLYDYSGGSIEFRAAHIKFIGKCLNDYLLQENVPANFEIVDCNNVDVILSDENSKYYRMMNTRMEIYVR